MSGGGQFCLRWNNHQPNMVSVFSSLLQNDQLVDVTLLAENNEIHAHKIVLSACSPYFQSLFIRNPCKHPVIILADVKFIYLKNLVEFMYNGEINIFQDHLPELLRVAELLKVKGLEEIPSFDFSNDIDQQQQSQDMSGIAESDNDEMVDGNLISNKLSSSNDATNPVNGIDNALHNNDIDDDIDDNVIKSTTSTTSTNFRRLRSTSAINQTNVTPSSSHEPSSYSFNTTLHLEQNDDLVVDDKMIINLNPHNLCKTMDNNMTTTQTIPDNDMEIKTKQMTATTKRKSGPGGGGKRKMIRQNENFIRALEAVRFEGIGFCKAARMHGVNNRTLWLEYQKLGYPTKKSRKKQAENLKLEPNI